MNYTFNTLPKFISNLINKRSRKKPLRNESGFAMMETLVALSILLFVGTGLVNVFVQSVQATGRAKYHTAAIYIARAKMEDINNTDFASIPTQYLDGVSNPVIGSSLPTGSACVVTYPNGIATDPLEVTVTVSWPENADTRSVQLTTLVTAMWPLTP